MDNLEATSRFSPKGNIYRIMKMSEVMMMKLLIFLMIMEIKTKIYVLEKLETCEILFFSRAIKLRATEHSSAEKYK